MMCQRIGLPPISIMGLGRSWDSSLILLPSPPARITAFMSWSFGPFGLVGQDIDAYGTRSGTFAVVRARFGHNLHARSDERAGIDAPGANGRAGGMSKACS